MRATDRSDLQRRFTSALAATVGALVGSTTLAQAQCNSTYTTAGDFDGGAKFNTVTNGDQLELAVSTQPLPFVNIACSGRGTLVRIDVNTGAVIGEYFTAPNGMGRDPSRTTVDRLGNVWVSNRAETGVSQGVQKGSVTRVGIVIGGTRGTVDALGNFTPDPLGEYLQPPFQYSTCIDRDGDGLIRTSRGLANILAWSNAGNADADGGVSTADDEALINYTRIIGTAARTVAIDANNDVWTGGLNNQAHEKLSGLTGQPVPGTQFNLGAGGYGGLIDGNGILWSARGGSGLLRYDPATGTGVVLGNSCGDYGLGIDAATGNIWHTGLFTGTTSVRDPAGACVIAYGHGNSGAQGCAVDSNGNVWVAHSLLAGYTTIGHLRTDGTLVGNVNLTHASGSGSGPTGVAVDTNGKIWVACYYSNNALRIDPALGANGGGGFPVGAVDLVVDLGSGATPYNYSDMTGFVSIGATSPTGTWTKLQDSGTLGQDWGTLSWNSQEPAGTSVVVEIRAADSPVTLPTLPFVPVINGQPTCGSGTSGQYLEIRATLSRLPSVNTTPVLFDLTANCCALGGATLDCPLDFTEIWTNGPAGGQTAPAHTGMASYTDACTQNVVLSYSDVSVPGTTVGAPEVIVTRTWSLTDGCGTNLSCDQIITLLSPSGLAGLLTLDAGPGQCPNVVAVNGNGTTDFTLVGTWLHAATNVDASSLQLRRSDGVGNKLKLSSLPLTFEDVARPYYGVAGGCHTLGAEGHLDAVVEIPNWMLRRAFALDRLAPGTLVEVRLIGRLLDGTTFDSADVLRVQ